MTVLKLSNYFAFSFQEYRAIAFSQREKSIMIPCQTISFNLSCWGMRLARLYFFDEHTSSAVCKDTAITWHVF